jgi:hypothetical protein
MELPEGANMKPPRGLMRLFGGLLFLMFKIFIQLNKFRQSPAQQKGG